MGNLTQPITGLSSNDPVPGTYLEVLFAQGQLSGDTGTPKVLFIGPKTTAGTATLNTTVYQLTGEDDALDKGGRGMPVHRAMRRFNSICKSAQCYAVFHAQATSGTAASNKVTFAGGTAAATGVVNYTLTGETIQVGIPKGTTVTAAATALKNEINLQLNWPVTAVSTAGATTITCRYKGTDGLYIRHHASITPGITMTCTASAATLQSGAGVPVVSSALDAIEPDKYDYIVPCYNPGATAATADARVGLIRTQVLAQALPVVGIRQQVIIGHAGTVSQAVTFTAQGTNGPANSPRFQVVWQEKSEWEPMEVAAAVAAVRYNKEVANPVYNYDNYGKRANDIWGVPKQYLNSDYPTRTELSTAISGGLTPVAVAGGTKTYIVRSCTASTDVRVRDTAKVTEADKFAADLAARYESMWSSANLQDDPADANVMVAPTTLTPKRLKSLTILPLYKSHSDAGWLDSDKTMDKVNGDVVACATGIDPNNGTRINARCPIHATKQAHQFAALISENSSA